MAPGYGSVTTRLLNHFTTLQTPLAFLVPGWVLVFLLEFWVGEGGMGVGLDGLDV